MNSPCHKTCPDRNAECHKYCEEYKKFEQKILERREAKKRENDRYSDPKRSKKNDICRRGIKTWR